MSRPSDPVLLRWHTDALWRTDARDRATTTNEPDGVTAPRIFLARGLASVEWRIGADVDDTVADELTRLLESEPVLSSLELDHPPRHEEAYRRLLGTDDDPETGPAWWLPEREPAGGAVLLGPRDLGVLADDWTYVRSEYDALAPVAAVVDGGRVVSACRCARRTADAAEAGVDTDDRFTGRGFATSTVGTWAQAVRATGRLPLYSTSWDNLASQRVAARLEAVPYALDWSLA